MNLDKVFEMAEPTWFIKSDQPQKHQVKLKSLVDNIEDVNNFDEACEYLKEDMKNMLGINPDKELIEILTYEIRTEIVENILSRLKEAAFIDGQMQYIGVSKDRLELKRIDPYEDTTMIFSPLAVSYYMRIAADDITMLDKLPGFISIEGPIASTNKDGRLIYRDCLTLKDYVMHIDWDLTPIAKVNITMTDNGPSVTISDIVNMEALNPRLIMLDFDDLLKTSTNKQFMY